jgi:thioredoxin 1
MACICIGGICIPYESLLALLFFVWRPIVDFIKKMLGYEVPAKVAKKIPVSAEGACCCDLKLRGEYLQNSSDWSGVASAKTPVVVRYTAQWCGPCKRIEPLFQQLAEENATVGFLAVDVDDHDEIFASTGASGVPFFQVYKDGECVESWTGANNTKLKEAVAHYK